MADLIEQKLEDMVERNPLRMDFYRKYQEIIADYNREKDRVTIEETFKRLLEFYESLDEEEKRAASEGLSDDELALFDLLKRHDLTNADRERLKHGSQELLEALTQLLRPMQQWTEKDQTQAEVEVFILDRLYTVMPMPPYNDDDDAAAAAQQIYDYIWQRSNSGAFPAPAAA